MAMKHLLSAAGESFKSSRLLKWQNSWRLAGRKGSESPAALGPQVEEKCLFLEASVANVA